LDFDKIDVNEWLFDGPLVQGLISLSNTITFPFLILENTVWVFFHCSLSKIWDPKGLDSIDPVILICASLNMLIKITNLNLFSPISEPSFPKDHPAKFDSISFSSIAEED
jgi:hypothetical protein